MQRLSKKIAHIYLALGVVLSLAFCWHLYHLESERIDHQFRREIDQHAANIEQMLVQHYEIVHGLANALGLLKQPEPDYFAQLCQPVRRRHDVIESLAWFWHVDDKDRTAFERHMLQLDENYAIKSFASDDTLLTGDSQQSFRPIGQQDDYLPMVAVTSGHNLQEYLGFDIFSRKDIVSGLMEAMNRDQIYVSGAYRHSDQDQDQDKDHRLDFTVFYPVFQPSTEKEPRLFTGVVSATFAIESLLQHELEANLDQWSININSPNNPDLAQGIFHSAPEQPLAAQEFSYQRSIAVGDDRQWEMVARPSQAYVEQHRTRGPLAALLAGLALTGLVYYIWLSQLYRTHNIESLVARRTEELSAANKRLRELSQTDALTGVANRRLFEQRLHHEWLRLRRAKKYLSLMMIDVDYFKPYNDFYGHQQGDDTLVRIARCIAETVQRPADLVARYGGEEFIVLLPDTDDKALDLADDILQAIRRLNIPHCRSRSSDRVTASIGFGFARANELESPQQLIIAADKAMYHAKASGRNRIAYAAVDGAETRPVSYHN
jgi:diguanylate cyclase (GGDEF)-like protein